MNTKEIEEAVKVIDKLVMPYIKGDAYEKHYKVLLTLAQDYLAVKGLPEERPVRYENVKREMGLNGVIIEREKNITYNKEDEAFNQTPHLCKLAWIKSVPSEFDIKECLVQAKIKRINPETALRTLLLGRVGK